MSIPCLGALIDYRALDTAAFSTNNGYVSSKHWTNDVFGNDRVLRPFDQTRQIQNSLVGTNTYAFQFDLNNTNNAIGFGAVGYVVNHSTNSGANGLSWGLSKYGFVADLSDSFGALHAGTTPALLGVAEGSFNAQVGVLGLAWGQFNNQTNVAVHGRSTSAGHTGNKRIGGYFETMTDDISGGATAPPFVSSVIYGDSRNSGDPLLMLSTNNGTYMWGVTSGGDLQQVNGSAVDKVMTSDASGVGTWRVFPSSAGETNNILSVVSNSFGIFGQGHTNYIARFTPNTNTVGDSIMYQVSSNQIWIEQANAPYTNSVTNIFVGQRTGPGGPNANNSNFLALAIQAPTASQYSEIFSMSGSNFTGNNLLLLNKSWVVGASVAFAGQSIGGLYPVIDATYSIGTTSSRVHGVYSDGNGFFASPNANMNFGAISGYGFGVTTDHINVFNNSAGVIAQFILNPYGNAAGMDIDNGHYLMGGGGPSTPATYLKFPSAGLMQLGTNNNSSSATIPQTNRIQGINGSNTDSPGGSLFISGGPSAGTGAGGNVGFETAGKGTVSSASENAKQNRLLIAANPVTLTTNSATLVFNFTIPTADTMVGGEVAATTKISDGVDQASVRERFAFQAIRKGSTVTVTNSASTPMATLATGTATIVTTWTTVVNSQSVDVKCTVVTGGINSTNTKTRWRAEFDSDAIPIITAQ